MKLSVSWAVHKKETIPDNFVKFVIQHFLQLHTFFKKAFSAGIFL